MRRLLRLVFPGTLLVIAGLVVFRPADRARLDGDRPVRIALAAPITGEASTTGEIMRGDERIAQISLMFSHIDNNLAGAEFPEENFVFTDMFNSLLTGFVETPSEQGQ